MATRKLLDEMPDRSLRLITPPTLLAFVCRQVIGRDARCVRVKVIAVAGICDKATMEVVGYTVLIMARRNAWFGSATNLRGGHLQAMQMLSFAVVHGMTAARSTACDPRSPL